MTMTKVVFFRPVSIQIAAAESLLTTYDTEPNILDSIPLLSYHLCAFPTSRWPIKIPVWLTTQLKSNRFHLEQMKSLIYSTLYKIF